MHSGYNIDVDHRLGGRLVVNSVEECHYHCLSHVDCYAYAFWDNGGCHLGGLGTTEAVSSYTSVNAWICSRISGK